MKIHFDSIVRQAQIWMLRIQKYTRKVKPCCHDALFKRRWGEKNRKIVSGVGKCLGDNKTS